MKFLTCKACGEVFPPKAALHYVAREDGQKGVAAVFGSLPEEKWYDAFDCPNCGEKLEFDLDSLEDEDDEDE